MQFLNLPGLDLIYGPMFSGKTSEMLRKLSIYGSMDLNVVYVNAERDNRNSEKNLMFSSHNPVLQFPKNVNALKVNKLSDILKQNNFKDYQIIGIDEAQFFPNLYDVVLELIEKHGKRVIVAGLDSDYKRKQFGQVIELIPHAEHAAKLYSYCGECKKHGVIKKAIYTKLVVEKKDNEENNDKGNPIVVGGSDMFIAACRECFHI